MAFWSKHRAAQGFEQGQHGVQRVAVGKYLYLFRKAAPANQLLIWAHGGTTLLDRPFTAGVPIAWLGPHGQALAHDGLELKLDPRLLKHYELTQPTAQIHDYYLSKMPGGFEDSFRTFEYESYAYIQHHLANRRVALDIVTVRNRGWTLCTSLKSVLEEVRPLGYGLILISCCRGGGSPNHQANTNPHRFVEIPAYNGANM